MTTKTCKKCGWVLDIRDPHVKCPVCKTRFEVGICAKCGKPVEYYRQDRLVCRECYDTAVRKPDAGRNLLKRRREIYEEIKQKMAMVPKDYHRLTEAEWLETVKHFKGCALCESECVDARWYFIPFKEGGRYCAFNVIPVCDKCATKTRINHNYFLTDRQPGLIKIADYVEEKINEAITRSSGKSN